MNFYLSIYNLQISRANRQLSTEPTHDQRAAAKTSHIVTAIIFTNEH